MKNVFEKVVLVIFLSILTLFAGVIIWVTLDPVFELRQAVGNLQSSASQAVSGLNTRITTLENSKKR